MDKKVFCSKCMYCSKEKGATFWAIEYKCRHPRFGKVEKIEDTPIYPGRLFTVFNKDCEKINKNNDCPYFEEYEGKKDD